MRVLCPHCRCHLEILPDQSVAEVVCPSCGSSLEGVNETLISIKPETRLLGRFELIERVGRGYFGEVWKARDTDLRHTVAIKLPRTQDLSEEYRERFLREARTTAQLRHENIVRVLEVGRDEGTLFIVSDFVDGMTLAERILNQRPQPRESAQLCATLAQALHYAHELGVVHRDLKPSNVMLDRANKPYLVDFGLAKQDAGEFSMTATGVVLGTPAYMSPEQARGDSHQADRRSDVYSLGVVLYELLTGERPFKGSTHMLLRAIQMIEPSPPSRFQRDLPRDLETICLKAMSKEPPRRYATALEMAEDLQCFLHGEPIKARRVTSWERGRRWVRRNPLVATTSGVALLAVLGMLGAISARPTGVTIVRQKVRLTTEPVSAKIVFYPLSGKTGEPDIDHAVRPAQATPMEVDLEPGEYLVVAVPTTDDVLFHEVFRTVPAPDSGLGGMMPHLSWEIQKDGTVELPKITLPPRTILESVVQLGGPETMVVGDDELGDVPEHRRYIPPYLLGGTEATIGQVLGARRAAGLGNVKPLFLRLMKADAPSNDNPVTRMSYDDAVFHAEMMGLRLPSEFEWEYAATNGGTTKFPWGDRDDITDWEYGVAGESDSDVTQSGIRGLYSNVAEWTSSWPIPYPKFQKIGVNSLDPSSVMRIVRGGSESVVNGAPLATDWSRGSRSRSGRLRHSWQSSIGFRGARSVKARLEKDDFEGLR